MRMDAVIVPVMISRRMSLMIGNYFNEKQQSFIEILRRHPLLLYKFQKVITDIWNNGFCENCRLMLIKDPGALSSGDFSILCSECQDRIKPYLPELERIKDKVNKEA